MSRNNFPEILDLQKWSKENLSELELPLKWKTFFPKKNLLTWNDLWKEVFVLSLGDNHCLEDNFSCVFQGNNKIYLNKNFFLLSSKLKQQMIIFHELTHLVDKGNPHGHRFHVNKSGNLRECDQLTDYGGYVLELDLLESLKKANKLDDKQAVEMEKEILSHICT